MTQDVWLTRKEVADRWKMPDATLDQWAHLNRGPRYAKFGRHVRYRLSDVIDWENRQFEGAPVPELADTVGELGDSAAVPLRD